MIIKPYTLKGEKAENERGTPVLNHQFLQLNINKISELKKLEQVMFDVRVLNNKNNYGNKLQQHSRRQLMLQKIQPHPISRTNKLKSNYSAAPKKTPGKPGTIQEPSLVRKDQNQENYSKKESLSSIQYQEYVSPGFVIRQRQNWYNQTV